MTLTCFKAYDIRGRLGSELNSDIAYKIGRAFAQHLRAKIVVIGSDVRLSSEDLKKALVSGLLDSGTNVIDIGTTGTEEVYFAAFHLSVDGALEVTGSHNPINYNGIKLVGRNAYPINSNTGLLDIHDIIMQNRFQCVEKKGNYSKLSILSAYIEHLMSYIDINQLRPMNLVVNAGNGAAGHVIDAIETYLHSKSIPINFIKIHHNPDGNFPNGIPNPLLPENRDVTIRAIKKYKPDMGIAWDGDFDRCFLFDETGQFIEGYYVVGLLAETFIQKTPNAKIIHDPRLNWNTIDVVRAGGGIPIQSRTGHSFIKECMRIENAVYGGEMSAHHYFRDFAYCDSGMIPWLLVIELLSHKKAKLSQLIQNYIKSYPCSGEINYPVENAQKIISRIENIFKSEALKIDKTDGLGLEMIDWRMNIRISNTEPLLRLNIETRGKPELVWEKVKQIKQLISS